MHNKHFPAKIRHAWYFNGKIECRRCAQQVHTIIPYVPILYILICKPETHVFYQCNERISAITFRPMNFLHCYLLIIFLILRLFCKEPTCTCTWLRFQPRDYVKSHKNGKQIASWKMKIYERNCFENRIIWDGTH